MTHIGFDASMFPSETGLPFSTSNVDEVDELNGMLSFLTNPADNVGAYNQAHPFTDPWGTLAGKGQSKNQSYEHDILPWQNDDVGFLELQQQGAGENNILGVVDPSLANPHVSPPSASNFDYVLESTLNSTGTQSSAPSSSFSPTSPCRLSPNRSSTYPLWQRRLNTKTSSMQALHGQRSAPHLQANLQQASSLADSTCTVSPVKGDQGSQPIDLPGFSGDPLSIPSSHTQWDPVAATAHGFDVSIFQQGRNGTKRESSSPDSPVTGKSLQAQSSAASFSTPLSSTQANSLNSLAFVNIEGDESSSERGERDSVSDSAKDDHGGHFDQVAKVRRLSEHHPADPPHAPYRGNFSSSSSSSNNTNNNNNGALIFIKNGDSDVIQSEVNEAGNRRHLCPHAVCDKHFSTSGHARRHSCIHDSLRPFECPHLSCGATFTRRDNCTQHQRTRHRIKLVAHRITDDEETDKRARSK